MKSSGSFKRQVSPHQSDVRPQTKKNRSFTLNPQQAEHLLSEDDDCSNDEIEIVYDSAPRPSTLTRVALRMSAGPISVPKCSYEIRRQPIPKPTEEDLMDDDSIDECTQIELVDSIRDKVTINSDSTTSSPLSVRRRRNHSQNLLTDDEDGSDTSHKSNLDQNRNSQPSGSSQKDQSDVYNGPLVFRRDVVPLQPVVNPIEVVEDPDDWKLHLKWRRYGLQRKVPKIESDTDSSSCYEMEMNDAPPIDLPGPSKSATVQVVNEKSKSNFISAPKAAIQNELCEPTSSRSVATNSKLINQKSTSSKPPKISLVKPKEKPSKLKSRSKPTEDELTEKTNESERKDLQSLEAYASTSNVCRFSQTNFNIFDILEKKRQKHGQEDLPDVQVKAAVPQQKAASSENSSDSDEESSSSEEHPAPNHVPKRTTAKDKKARAPLNQRPRDKRYPMKGSGKQMLDAPYVSKLKKSFESILNDILSWNTSWLKDEMSELLPPNLCKEPLMRTKLTYADFEEYFSVFKPLILLEIWANIFERFLTLKSQPAKNINLYPFSYSEAGDFTIFTCKLLITKQDLNKYEHPTEGDLVLMEMWASFDAQDYSSAVVFGYVHDLNVQDLSKEPKCNSVNYFPRNCEKVVRYTIKTRGLNLRLDPSKLIRVRTVFYIRPFLRQCEAVCSLQLSPLKNAILKPNFQYSQIHLAQPTSSRSLPGYNSSQQKTICASFELVKQPTNINKILLIQGPPGTGKTHTIVGMVKKMYLDWDNRKYPKILICAPSNGAIDEIAYRLYRERGFLVPKTNRALRLVRVGQDAQISANTKKIFIDNLIESNLEQIKKERSDSQVAQMTQLDDRIKDIASKEKEFRQRGISPEDRDFKKLLREKSKTTLQLAEIKKANDNNEGLKGDLDIESIKKNLRRDIILKADVILSTLNSCRTQQLAHIYKEMKSFHCCIIDEASQCSEPEILMPLNYSSITKFILIGDPMQLPATVISSKATEYNYGRSLFERHFVYFNLQKKENNPVMMLDTQYRMNSEICQFPSTFFYSNLLKTDESTARRPFPLLHYAIFDVTGTKENCQNPKNIHNKLEGDFVARLYQVMCGFIKKNVELSERVEIRIGIVTPYQGQKRYITSRLGKQEIEVEVNTIDGFQGQERDIIVISSVRAFDEYTGALSKIGFMNSKQRLNVAITRAKHSLFVCMESRCMEHSRPWKLLIDDAIARRLFFRVDPKISDEQLGEIIHEKSHPLFQRSSHSNQHEEMNMRQDSHHHAPKHQSFGLNPHRAFPSTHYHTSHRDKDHHNTNHTNSRQHPPSNHSAPHLRPAVALNNSDECFFH
jgi:hypothetical protein